MFDTAECIQTAAALADRMDTRADPCQNFYQFACGGYVKKVCSQGSCDNKLIPSFRQSYQRTEAGPLCSLMLGTTWMSRSRGCWSRPCLPRTLNLTGKRDILQIDEQCWAFRAENSAAETPIFFHKLFVQQIDWTLLHPGWPSPCTSPAWTPVLSRQGGSSLCWQCSGRSEAGLCWRPGPGRPRPRPSSGTSWCGGSESWATAWTTSWTSQSQPTSGTRVNILREKKLFSSK